MQQDDNRSMSMSKNNLITSIEPEVIPSKNEPPAEVVLNPALKITSIIGPSKDLWKTFEIGGISEADRAVWIDMTSNLLRPFEELSSLLRFQLQHKFWLNAYLLASGLNQITEDYLHSDPLQLSKAANILGRLRKPFGPFLKSATNYSLNIWRVVNELSANYHKIAVWQAKLAQFVIRLAETSVINDPDQSEIDRLIGEGEMLLSKVSYLPVALKGEVNRLPSCFRSFDQQPEDLQEITRNFSNLWPDQHRRIVVAGVRTSGSFLAPLYSAYLKSKGYKDVTVITIRPESPFTRDEKAVLRRTIKENGLVLLCDDPPISGSTLANAAMMLELEGLPYQNIVLLLQLFGNSASLPYLLKKYPAVLMEWSEWSIHRQMELNTVKAVLAEACSPSYQMTGLERIPDVEQGKNREHTSAWFKVTLSDKNTNLIFARLIRVMGVGLGYFGEHVAAVSQKLTGYSAPIIALHRSVIYQQINATTQPLNNSTISREEKWISQMVNYIIERNRQMPAKEDISLRLFGRNAVWEVASNLLSQAFGRAWFLTRVPIIDPYVKKILKSSRPSVIDGDMSVNHWVVQTNGDTRLLKLNLAERDFSHQDLFSFDPAYDLACLQQELNNTESVDLRRSYELLSGEKISPERWMLYQLVHLWDLSRQEAKSTVHDYRKMARVVQSYFSETYFKDLEDNQNGPLCAFDIDGVLETRQLGFSSLTPTSARCMRALSLHGYRILLATGRSLSELKERCAQYHVAGGVAEYGGVIYEHSTGQSFTLLTAEEKQGLEQLSERLAGHFGIFIDSNYEFSVRAFRLDESGHRAGLNNMDISRILYETAEFNEIEAIPGVAQTDFIPRRINKGLGLTEWISHFGVGIEPSGDDKPIQIAIGDSSPDLPMLAMAKKAFVPANASHKVRQAGIHVTNRPYQRGMEQAVTAFLGHKPGECVICDRNTLPKESSYMVDILSAQEYGSASMIWVGAKLLAGRMAR